MKNGKLTQAIIFDLGNVLIHFNAVRAARRFSRETGVPFEKVWKHFFISRIEKAYTRGEITTQAFFNHACKAFHCRMDFKTFARLWNDIFWENRGIRPILKGLAKHYPLYLISNTNELHFDHLQKTFPEILGRFRQMFPSHRVGRRKPDPRIYWKVLRTIKRRPEETLFVDDMPKFVNAARRIGMKGIRFRSNAGLRKELRRLGIKL